MAHPGVPSSMSTVPSGYHKEQIPLEARLTKPQDVLFRQIEYGLRHETLDAPCYLYIKPKAFIEWRYNICEFVFDLGGGELTIHPECYVCDMYYVLQIAEVALRRLEYLEIGWNRISRTRWLKLEGEHPLDIYYDVRHILNGGHTSYCRECVDSKKVIDELWGTGKIERPAPQAASRVETGNLP